MLLSEVKRILKKHRDQLMRLGARGLAVFGSVATGRSSPRSDVDVLVDFDVKKGLFGFVGLKDFLETILEHDVDLVTKAALHPALKKRILREAKHVF